MCSTSPERTRTATAPAPSTPVHLGVDQRAGRRTRAAGERLALDAALVGAQDDLARPARLDEIGVRAPWARNAA